MTITIEQLARVFPTQTGELLDMVLTQMVDAGLADDVKIAAAFAAQIGHESIDLKFTREINGEKTRYAPWFGRGYIQITWKSNYEACAAATGIDCVNHPELLELPENAVKSAIWFYTSHGLHRISDIDAISKRINGAGIKEASRLDRRRRYERALKIFSEAA